MPAVARGPRRRSLTWLQGLGCGAAVALVPAAALLLGVLLLPGMLSVAYDRQPGRPVARTVLLCGAAAVVAPAMALWSAAAVGWILAELAPVVALAVLETVTAARAARLRSERDKLASEWGFEND